MPSRSTWTERRFAVCVGINAYLSSSGLSELRYAEADATAMDAVLDTLGFATENRRLLLGPDATLDAINAALDDVLLTRPSRNDLVVFYFAGHGVPITLCEDDTPDPSIEVFLAPVDFTRTAVAQRGFRLRQALGMARLRRDYFEGEGARKRLFIFDSCYSGEFPGPRYRSDTDPTQTHIQQLLNSTA